LPTAPAPLRAAGGGSVNGAALPKHYKSPRGRTKFSLTTAFQKTALALIADPQKCGLKNKKKNPNNKK
jgi:hypothetical protein